MAKLARDVMTTESRLLHPQPTLDEVAKLMVIKDCGEIPVVDRSNHIIGVVTDRDIVCRIVAVGKNPMAHTAAEARSQPVVTVREAEPLDGRLGDGASQDSEAKPSPPITSPH